MCVRESKARNVCNFDNFMFRYLEIITNLPMSESKIKILRMENN